MWSTWNFIPNRFSSSLDFEYISSILSKFAQFGIEFNILIFLFELYRLILPGLFLANCFLQVSYLPLLLLYHILAEDRLRSLLLEAQIL